MRRRRHLSKLKDKSISMLDRLNKPTTTNEANLMWREVHDEARRFRDKREDKQERQLAVAVRFGHLNASLLGEYHWRVWNTGRPRVYIDFWPRTVRGWDPAGRASFHCTVAILLSKLRP